MGAISDLCRSIDLYNEIEKKKEKSFIVNYRQKRLYKKLLKMINKISKIDITVGIINDFFANYIASEQIIKLNNCKCNEKTNTKQYIFSITNDEGTLTYSTVEYLDPTISISINKLSDPYTKKYKYINTFHNTNDFDLEKDRIGNLCEELIKGYIMLYLQARLDLYKDTKED